MTQNTYQLRLEPWSEKDEPLLEKLMGDPEMMTYLGGPETPEKIAARHIRYMNVEASGEGHMFAIVIDDGETVGSLGFWNSEEHGQGVYEMGWSVLPNFQGRGIALNATMAALALMRAEAKHRFVHAFPSVLNGASNAICRKAGFTLLGEGEVEYPKGQFMRCNDWQLDLLGENK